MANNKIVLSDGTTLIDLSTDTITNAGHIMAGYIGHLADGTVVTGTGGGSSPSATAHSIYFEFLDGTNTTLTVYYDSAFISDAITATTPTTYSGKTVTLAQLDGVAWYEPANIPLNTELIDYAACLTDTAIDESGQEITQQWYYASDYTPVESGMTFSYIAGYWAFIIVYNSSKTVINSIQVWNDGTVDEDDSNIGHGTLSGAKLPSGSAYIRMSSTGANSTRMSLIRTA